MNQDDNKQKALGLVFLLFLLIVYKQMIFDPYYYGKQKTAEPMVSGNAASAPAVQPGASPTPGAEAPVIQPAGQRAYPSDEEIRAAGTAKVRTTQLSAEIGLLGGRLTSLKLLEFKETQAKNSSALDLVQHPGEAPYPLGVYIENLDDTWIRYSLSQASIAADAEGYYNVAPGKQEIFKLSGKLPDGRTIEKTLRFEGDRYFIEVNAALSAPAKTPLEVEWTQLIPATSPSLLDPYNSSGFTWNDGKRASRVAFAKFKQTELSLPGISWLALADKYFSVTLISPEQLTNGRALKTGELYGARISGNEQSVRGLIFAGPKSYQMLRSYGHGLEQNIDLGWTGLVSAPLLMVLHAVEKPLGNYGLAIIVLTILVKLALLPLTAASYKQMKAMQELSPEIKRIRETVTDKAEQQQELMALYKKRGVNPLGGCLPILIQLPIFIGLYSALLLAIELRHAPFALWVQDLSATERAMMFGWGVPVMAILFVISMVVQQLTTPSPGMDPVQRKMMLGMPVVMGFFFISAPAGLTLYWLTSNLISIGQNYALRNSGGKSSLLVTLGVSAIIFLFALFLTLVS